MAEQKVPSLKVISGTVNKWWEIKNKIKDLEKELAKNSLVKQIANLKGKEKELEEYLINNIQKSKAGGVSGDAVTVEIDTSPIPIVEDEDKFRSYLNRTKRFDLAQVLKPSRAAVVEFWESGGKIPGIGRFNAVKLKYRAKKK